ncbi:DUF11 domain-containing protein [Candidatus Saccharibacteria bacterium]|nr:DUF11 domain-containing protein [Candidatus Saccharibacteria bacterium]
MRRKLTIFSGIALLASFIFTGTAFAWGPSDRPTYTNESPADYATFNSITNNGGDSGKGVGDERNFVRVREANTNNDYSDEVFVEPGKEYEVYIYYHNNAGSDTNSSGVGIALLTKVAATYPARISKNAEGTLTGEITWKYITSINDTVHDGKVWDEAYLKTNYDDVILRYKPGTATIYNGGATNGSVLSTNLFSESGTYIGFNELNGVVKGCAEYSGHITYTLVAEKVDSTFNKMVSLDGETWGEEVVAKPGDYVTYRVSFQNTGNTTLTNVIFKDTHDAGLSLRSGSTKVFDINNENGKEIDDIIDLSGYNTGDAIPTALVQIIYQAQVARDNSLCNKTLNNTMSVAYNSVDQKTDDASVIVACDEPEPTPAPEDCATNPNLPGCQEKTCATNPEMEGCKELPNTGPVEIIMAIVIIIGIGTGGYYLYRTQKTLKTVEGDVSGKGDKEGKDSSQKPDNMVK